jgi:hypothetical protein
MDLISILFLLHIIVLAGTIRVRLFLFFRHMGNVTMLQSI